MPSSSSPSPQLPPRGGFRPEDRAPRQAEAAYGRAGGPPPSSRRWGWILAAVAIVLGSGLIVCCGGLYVAFQSGAEQMTSQLQSRLAGHPVIAEHIGEIESLDVSLQKTGELGEQQRIVLTIEGSKGSGVLIGRQRPGELELDDLVLETPDGEQYPLEFEPTEAVPAAAEPDRGSPPAEA